MLFRFLSRSFSNSITIPTARETPFGNARSYIILLLFRGTVDFRRTGYRTLSLRRVLCVLPSELKKKIKTKFWFAIYYYNDTRRVLSPSRVFMGYPTSIRVGLIHTYIHISYLCVRRRVHYYNTNDIVRRVCVMFCAYRQLWAGTLCVRVDLELVYSPQNCRTHNLRGDYNLKKIFIFLFVRIICSAYRSSGFFFWSIDVRMRNNCCLSVVIIKIIGRLIRRTDRRNFWKKNHRLLFARLLCTWSRFSCRARCIVVDREKIASRFWDFRARAVVCDAFADRGCTIVRISTSSKEPS